MTLKVAGVKPVAIIVPLASRSVTHWPVNELPERSDDFKIRSSSNKKITSIFRKLVRISRFFCKYLFISKTRVLDSSPYQFELKIPSQALDNLP